MKIAVSGASGFVGKTLCSSLEGTGHEVFRLSRTISTDQLEKKAIAWDPNVGLANPEVLNGFDAFIHLAGKSIAVRWTQQTKQQIRDSRVDATQILAEQIAKLESPPPTILSASAVGIYGPDLPDTDTAWHEDARLEANDFLADVARQWEAASEPMREAGLRVVHPRLGIVLGKGGGALQKALPLFQWGLGGRIGDGKQIWSWISLNDCVRALLWLLEDDLAKGAYNLVSPTPVTNAEFTAVLGRHLGRPTFFPAPAMLLRLVLGEMADALLLSSCRVLPSRLEEEGFVFEDAELHECLNRELA